MSAPLLCRLTSQVEPLSHKRRENLVDFPGNDYMDFKEDIVTFIRLIDNWSSIDNYCFFQWERKEEGDLNKPWIYSLQPSPQRRRFQSSKSIFVRLIPKCRVSCDEQRNSISSNTTRCHRQTFDFDCVFFGLWRFYLYPMMEHFENMFNGVLRKANFRPVVFKIISLIERWRIANTRWLVALCKQRRGMPNQLILKDLIWDRSDWT